jgi:anaerobic selenocysteine-containing dehydrogenase
MPVITKNHVCELCEAGCGLSVDVDDGKPVAVRANDEDVFSKGFLCPKGLAALALDRDPDRLRTPVRRTPSGDFEPITWDEAFDLVAGRLLAVQNEHGRDSVAVYMGTPIVHKHGALLMRAALLGALRTKNSTSAGSQDTSTRFAASYFLYGSAFSLPVPDIDRTQYFLCIGANPLVSNGSLLTAPNVRERIAAIRKRGGKVVVVDPRRTETARAADEHVAILPGADAAFVLALIQVLVQDGRIGEAELAGFSQGWSEVRGKIGDFLPEKVAQYTGVAAETTRRLAREFAAAPSKVAYARVGVCNNEFGTIASYAVDLLNIAAGALGKEGGALFATPAIDVPLLARITKNDGYARWRSRVRGLPETAGDVPASTLAEEMETAGPGQVRAFLTLAGNPVLTTPNGRRLARALASLDFMVSIDFYVNETTRFAHVILPPCSPFSDDHVDAFFSNVAAHNAFRWTAPAVPRRSDERADWEILLELSYRLGGGPTGVRPLDQVFRALHRFGFRYKPDDTVALALRLGPYGDKFLPWRAGLNAKKARAAHGGIDLGPLQTGFRRRVYHASGLVDLAPPLIMSAFSELLQAVDRPRSASELLMIGRRDIRSNNSWMHNLPRLVSGRPRCVLFVNPADAERLGLTDGAPAMLESRIHSAQVPIRVTDEVRPGVVSLPHGWGHAQSGRWQRVAGENAGVSANDWTDDQRVEAIVGQSILNGIPVLLKAVERGASAVPA